MRPSILAGVAVIVAALSGPSAAAQIKGDGPPQLDSTVRMRGYGAIGWRAIDLDELNAAMTTASFPQLSPDFISIGGGGAMITERFVIGLEAEALLGVDSRVARGDFESKLSGGHLLLALGVSPYSGSRLRVTPKGSIGLGLTLLQIAESGRFTFDEILVDPPRSAEMSQYGLLLGAGLEVEFLVPLRSVRVPGRALSIQVDGGYSFAPHSSSWHMRQTGLDTPGVTGGPDAGLAGPYARLSIGVSEPRRRRPDMGQR